MSKTNQGIGGGGGGGHSNASFVPPSADEQIFNSQIQTVEKKKFAIEINEKDTDYDPYQNRIVKHPTT